MNTLGFAGSIKRWGSILGTMLAFNLVFFSADCKAQHTPPKAEKTIGETNSIENVPEDSSKARFDLPSIVRYGLKNNPNLKITAKNIDIETYGMDTAIAEMMPKVDGGGGVTRYRYETPIEPLVIDPPLGPGTEFPPFRKTVWSTALTFKLPLFRGGRLYRNMNVAQMRNAIAHDNYKMSRQDLVYNLSSVYYKIEQLEKLLVSNDATVAQLEAHRKNVDLFLKTGTAPKLDLLKTEVELAHAIENWLLVKNNLASSYELLKVFMGMDDMSRDISITTEKSENKSYPSLEESMTKAFSQRPDYKAVAKKRLIAEERVKIAQGKRLPDISAIGQYGGKAGNDTGFREDWYYGLMLTVPILDGGLIKSEINKEKVELEKVKEEDRSLKLSITRDVRDAHLNIANATERIDTAEKAIESARESLRVERLKYETGAGTTTDVIDAQTALSRAEADYYQALFDKAAAIAYLKKAIGEDEYDEEVQK